LSAAPRVTVALPTYNAAHWLPAAIESVLAQHFADLELLVLDNASTDDTAAIMAQYDDPRIVYQVSERNVGFAGNVHLGCRMARGEFVVILGADDILLPGFLSAAVAFLDSEPGCTMVHGPAAWIDTEGRHTGRTGPGWARVTPGPQAMLDIFRYGFCLTTMVMRSSAIRGTGPFDESWLELIDVWLFCRLCLGGDIGHLDRVLVEYRVHDSAMSMPMYRSNAMFRKQIAAVREAFAWPEALAAGASAQRAAAEFHIARVAIEILHVSRADGYGRYLINLGEIVLAVPRVLLRPATWMRIGFGLLPKPVLRGLARLRGRRRFEPEGGLAARKTT
jgi:glycosyltransferase involved in cell wall biosynthesis